MKADSSPKSDGSRKGFWRRLVEAIDRRLQRPASGASCCGPAKKDEKKTSCCG